MRKIEIPNRQVEQLESENAELLYKSALAEMEIENIRDENAELLFRVALLEMGGEKDVADV